MGRAISMENRQDSFEKRLKLVEDALEELVQTKIHHVDLVEETTTHVEEEKPKKRKTKKETVSA